MYFRNCNTLDELKQEYRRLALQHHPDKGGATETMTAINNAYEDAFRRVEMGAGKTTTEVNEEWDIEQVFVEKVQAIVGLNGILIELVGRWLWITGDTFPVKNEIKAAGFFWARKKRAWFWRADEDKSVSRKEQPLDKIRDTYGSKALNLSGRIKALAS